MFKTISYPIYRLKCDPNNSLAPSYKTLFDNVDRTVDCDGYENILPLHLKTITIAGLPVEDIPCLEVWDLSGKVCCILHHCIDKLFVYCSFRCIFFPTDSFVLFVHFQLL